MKKEKSKREIAKINHWSMFRNHYGMCDLTIYFESEKGMKQWVQNIRKQYQTGFIPKMVYSKDCKHALNIYGVVLRQFLNGKTLERYIFTRLNNVFVINEIEYKLRLPRTEIVFFKNE